MNKKILISALALVNILIFSGCNDLPRPTTVYIPELNKVSTAEVGQNMYEKINAIFEYESSVQLLDPKAESEYKYQKKYFDKINGSCVMIVNGIDLIDDECDREFKYKMDGFTSFDLKKVKLSTPIKYKIVPASPIEITQDSFKYQVLYQGKVGNKLNITFQEFFYSPNNYDFIIRDSYTQNIQYELDSDGEAIIGFKGLRIKVLQATNLDITYQVIHDYN